MSHSNYTASERRGLLVIALVALLIVGSGVVLALCGRPRERVEEIPVVVEHPEIVDTANLNSVKEKKSKKKRKDSSTDKKSRSKKESKSYRRRNPLEEPV
ncbi:MAG: hypothetical protein J1E16_08880 [Muribaculaceae bacterium]|nr:hypothetical protein [Muribaculaceae bacterium]